MAAVRHVANLQTVLCKLQAVYGVGETALIGTDAAEVYLDGFKASSTPMVSPIRLAGNGTPSKSVIGPSKGEITMPYPIKNGGAATPGQWTKPLQCSGFKESAVGSVYTYTPTYKQSEMKDCTVWAYSGNLDTTSSLLRKMTNCQFDWEITLDWRGEAALGKVEFTGFGSSPAAPATATSPAITKNAANIVTIVGATVGFFGDADYDPLMIKFKNTRGPVPLANYTSGYGMTLLTAPAAIEWEATVYMDTGALAETTMRAGTLGTISVMWGTAPEKITIATAASKAQITECTVGEQDGVETYELKGIIVDNDFSIACDCT